MLNTTTASNQNPHLQPHLSDDLLCKKDEGRVQKNFVNLHLRFKLAEKSEKKLRNFFAEFGFQVVFFERVDSFAFG